MKILELDNRIEKMRAELTDIIIEYEKANGTDKLLVLLEAARDAVVYAHEESKIRAKPARLMDLTAKLKL